MYVSIVLDDGWDPEDDGWRRGHPNRMVRAGATLGMVGSGASRASPQRRDVLMAKRQLVLAVFPDELAADSAAVALKGSGIADGDAIGILALDADGKLKQDKVGKRSTGKGAAIGGVIAVTTTALLGPAVLGGMAVGALHHKNLGLSDADKARLTVDLNAGKAAVGVMAHYDIAPAVSDRLTQLGGAPERHDLSDDALEAAGATATV
jgi:hypothetical protein